MDKKETQYKPKFYQNRHRGHSRGRQSNFHPLNQSFSRDWNRNEGNYNTMTGIIDQIIEIGLEIIIEGMTEDLHIGLMTDVVITDPIMGIEATMDKTIEVYKIYRHNDSKQRYGDRIKVEIGLETIVMTETEVESEVKTEMDRCRTGPKPCQMTDENQDPGPTLE